MTMHTAVLIPGDGIGPEVADAAKRVLDAAQAPIQFIERHAGLAALDRGADDVLPAATVEAIREHHVALKGPCTTPIGKGFSSINVALRKKLNLYAAVRPVRSLPGVKTRFENVDLVIIRENTEGLYSGIENLITDGVVRWSPHVLVDAHEARGPPRYYDFYTLWPRNLYGGQAIVDLTEEEILPEIIDGLEEAGFDHYFYHIVPRGIEADPSIGLNRGGTGARSLSSYGGPAGMITFLFESLRNVDSRIGIYQRAISQWTAMESLARYVADHPERVIDAVADSHEELVTRGSTWEPSDSIFIRWESFVTHEAPYRLWHENEVVELDDEGKVVHHGGAAGSVAGSPRSAVQASSCTATSTAIASSRTRAPSAPRGEASGPPT